MARSKTSLQCEDRIDGEGRRCRRVAKVMMMELYFDFELRRPAASAELAFCLKCAFKWWYDMKRNKSYVRWQRV